MVHLLGPREFGEFTDRVGLAIWAKSPTSNSFLNYPASENPNLCVKGRDFEFQNGSRHWMVDASRGTLTLYSVHSLLTTEQREFSSAQLHSAQLNSVQLSSVQPNSA